MGNFDVTIGGSEPNNKNLVRHTLQPLDISEFWPWLVQFLNYGHCCWFNSSSLALMWTMKKLQIEMPQPKEEDWTYWGWITYWYNLERRDSKEGNTVWIQ